MAADKYPPSEDFFGADGLRPRDVGHVDTWQTLALDLLEGTLPPHVAGLLEAHLATCPDCRRALAEQGSIASMLRAVAEVTPPHELERAVLAGLPHLPEPRPATTLAEDPRGVRVKDGTLQSLRRLLTIRVWLPAAAVALVAAVAVSSYYRMGFGLDEGVDYTAMESAQKATAVAPSEGAGGDNGTFQSVPGGADGQTTLAAMATTTTIAGGTAETTGVARPVFVLDLGLPGDDPGVLADRVEKVTGLDPLPRDSWVDGRTTYAALIAADEAAALAEDLGVVASELVPVAEYGAPMPPSLDTALRQSAGADGLPVLTPPSGDAAPGGRLWLPTSETGDRSGIEGDLIIILITLS
ncbi:MAG: anti-sigma factor family protein [Thermoleophilia bacterium]